MIKKIKDWLEPEEKELVFEVLSMQYSNLGIMEGEILYTKFLDITIDNVDGNVFIIFKAVSSKGIPLHIKQMHSKELFDKATANIKSNIHLIEIIFGLRYLGND